MAGRAGRKAPAGTPERAAEGPGPEPDARVSFGQYARNGVIAYSASQRRREIGIRIALGAQRNTVTAMFVRQGLAMAGIGVACGFIVAVAATRLLRSLLFHVSPMDPLTYACAALALCAAGALASYIPSRRTATVNPVEALRAE